MGVQIQDLIDKFKAEGVEAAEAEAVRIRAEARQEARAILDQAEAEGRDIIEKAKTEARKYLDAGNDALKQSARDTLLLLQQEIQKLLAIIVDEKVGAALSAESLTSLLPGLLDAWRKSDSDDLAVLLSPADLKLVEASFTGELNQRLLQGVELKPFPGLKAGFKIEKKNNAVYYDFSAEALSELLAQQLNSRLQEIVKKAAQEI
jgi:V/A-type H+/Na+-transporting ATPase subunit E